MKKAIEFLVVFIGVITSFENGNAQINRVKFEHINIEDGLSSGVITAINQDQYDFMWFGTWNGLNKYDGYEFTVYKTDIQDTTSISNNRVIDIYSFPGKSLWILTFDSVYNRYNYATDDFTRFPASYFTDAAIDSFDQFSVPESITYKNFRYEIRNRILYQIDLLNNTLIPFTLDPLDKYSLPNGSVYSIFLDKSNILWVGVEGVHKTNLDKKPFIHYKDLTEISFSSRSNINAIRAIYEDTNGNLWVGSTSLGVVLLNRQTLESKHFTSSPTDINSLSDNQIRAIVGDSHGFIWFGTKGGVDKYDPVADKFHHYTTESALKLPSNIVFSIVEDKNKSLWFGTWEGVVKMNDDRDSIAYYNVENQLLQSNLVRVVYCDKNNDIWVGTQGGGVTRLKRGLHSNITNEPVTPEHFVHHTGDAHSLSDNRVFSICEDAWGDIWIGTASGLDKLKKDGTFKHFNESNGLPDVMVMGILSDGRENMWFSHKKGLSKINIHTYEIRNYTSQDGLQDYEFTEDAFYKSKSGEMFFGGTNGFNSFFPDSIKNSSHLPEIVFTDFRIMNKTVPVGKVVNGRIVLEKSMLETNEIVLNHNDKIVTIEFAALLYNNPSGTRYNYMLEGFEQDWIETDARIRQATYSNLPPGSYRFKVKAANSDGVWTETPAVLKLTVNPPWWKTRFAIGGYVILVLFILYIFRKLILRDAKIKKTLEFEKLEIKKLHEIDSHKTRFFANVSHEFRTPLTLIIGPLEKLMQTTKNELKQFQLQLIHRNTKRLLMLIDQLMDVRKIEVGELKLALSLHDLNEYTREIAAGFEFEAKERKIDYTISLHDHPLTAFIDPAKVDKIIANLLSNAFKFTPDGGRIAISVNVFIDAENADTDHILIKVKDNGIGIPQEKKPKIFERFYQVKNTYSNYGTGIGLSLVQELVNIHRGQIHVESAENKGSLFTVSLPCWKEQSQIPEKLLQWVKNNLTESQEAVCLPRTKTTSMKTDTLHKDENKPELLIIEDNVDMRVYIRNEFSTSYGIHEAPNADTGLKLAMDKIPDIIICDVMMPGMDGFEVCRTIKTDERSSHIPVIMLTAKTSEQSTIEGFELGADDYVTKPFNVMILKSRVKNLINSRTALRKKFSSEPFASLKDISPTSVDEKLLNKINEIVEKNLDNADFKADDFAKEIGMSRAQLYRKINAISGQSVKEFLRIMRLKKAAKLLITSNHNISEVAFMVGFNSATYFAKSFGEYYRVTPTQFVAQHKENSQNQFSNL